MSLHSIPINDGRALLKVSTDAINQSYIAMLYAHSSAFCYCIPNLV